MLLQIITDYSGPCQRPFRVRKCTNFSQTPKMLNNAQLCDKKSNFGNQKRTKNVKYAQNWLLSTNKGGGELAFPAGDIKSDRFGWMALLHPTIAMAPPQPLAHPLSHDFSRLEVEGEHFVGVVTVQH